MKITIKNTDMVFATKETIDLTNRFVVDRENAAYYFEEIGEKRERTASSVFNTTNLVDISLYIGESLEVNVPKYTSAQGAQPLFAVIVFVDGEDNVVSHRQMSKADDTPSSGGSEVIEYEIPAGAKYVTFTLFNNAKAQQFGYEFSCVVI